MIKKNSEVKKTTCNLWINETFIKIHLNKIRQ